jgi:polygalacturonase
MWEIHPVLCRNVTVRNVTVNTHGPNNDGCNPESCTDVLIKDCYFDTGDDCIAIKSGRNNDGRRVNTPSESIVIQGCTFRDGHGGITIGSEVSGGARNVFAENCALESPVLYSALRIKSNAVRGGTVENICLRDINVGLVDRSVVDIDLFYEEGRKGSFLPTIRNILIERMTVKKCKTALNLVGYEEAPLRNIRLVDVDFREVSGGYRIEYVEGLELVNTRVNGEEIKR